MKEYIEKIPCCFSEVSAILKLAVEDKACSVVLAHFSTIALVIHYVHFQEQRNSNYLLRGKKIPCKTVSDYHIL